MSSFWTTLGFKNEPTRIEDIHTAYQERREEIIGSGDLMAQLGLEDAYLNALAAWEKEEDYCEKAVRTDNIHDNLLSEHVPGEPLTQSELQDIVTIIARTLHNPWKRNSIAAWKAIFNIDPFVDPQNRQFENILREAFLHFFGYYESSAINRNKSVGPRLMPIKTAQFVFEAAGWIDIKPSSEKERRELDWLSEELDVEATTFKKTRAAIRDFILVLMVFISAIILFFTVLFWIRG